MKKIRPYQHYYNVFVGIPNSALYKYILKNNLHEYMDDLGLLYLPGFDIKAKYFYRIDRKKLVNYDFHQRTDFDKKLLIELRRNRTKLRNAINSILSFLPIPVSNNIVRFGKRIKRKMMVI